MFGFYKFEGVGGVTGVYFITRFCNIYILHIFFFMVYYLSVVHITSNISWAEIQEQLSKVNLA